MNKKISLGAALAFALIVAAAVFSVTMVYARENVNELLVALQEREATYEKFSEVDRSVRPRYYGDINSQQLQDGIAEGYLRGIGDTHAKYYSGEEYARLIAGEEQQASIGVKLSDSTDGYLEVIEVFPDSPAYIAGIQKGALIIEVDEEAVTNRNHDKMRALLETGIDGSKVAIKVRTNGEDQRVDLTRRVVIVPTVQWEILPDTNIAYLHITDFDKDTANQFGRAFAEIKEQGGRALIFDFRGTQSNELVSASRILDRLVPAGTLISSVDKEGNTQELEVSDSNELAWPMAVIINSTTAGIPEIFAQVLRDYNKGKIVGTTSAGEGVQLETIRLSDGSAIELTVALYQSPKGFTFDGEGVKPDFDISLTGIEDSKWQSVGRDNDVQLLKAMEVVTTATKK